MKDLRCDHKLWRHFRHHVPQLIQVGLRERPHVSFEGSQSADKTCLPAERKVHFRGRVSQRLIGYRSMEAGAVDLHEQGAFGSDYRVTRIESGSDLPVEVLHPGRPFSEFLPHRDQGVIVNFIGSNSITLPQDAREAADIQVQLFEFVERSVSDAFVANQVETTMTQEQVTSTIDSVYEQAYSILQSMAESELDKS